MNLTVQSAQQTFESQFENFKATQRSTTTLPGRPRKSLPKL